MAALLAVRTTDGPNALARISACAFSIMRRKHRRLRILGVTDELRKFSLGRAVLSQDLAGPALGNVKGRLDMLPAVAANTHFEHPTVPNCIGVWWTERGAFEKVGLKYSPWQSTALNLIQRESGLHSNWVTSHSLLVKASDHIIFLDRADQFKASGPSKLIAQKVLRSTAA